MDRKLIICLCLLLAFAGTALAKEKEKGTADKGITEKSSADKGAHDTAPATKQLSGMSIVGNDEAPKSLYFVPWKSSEVGVETRLDAMLNEGDVPVDRDVFKRQLDFYKVSSSK